MLQSFEAGWLPLSLAFFAPDTPDTGLKIWKVLSCRPPHRAVRKGAALAAPLKHNLTRPVSEKHRVWQAHHKHRVQHACTDDPSRCTGVSVSQGQRAPKSCFGEILFCSLSLRQGCLFLLEARCRKSSWV